MSVIKHYLKLRQWNPALCRTYAFGRPPKEEITQPKPIMKKWQEEKGVLLSALEAMEPKYRRGPDTIRFLQTPIDFSPKNIKKWYDKRMDRRDILSQTPIKERLEMCGKDLSAAHFIVHRGGAVRFTGEKEWVRKNNEDDDEIALLPGSYVPGLFVGAIDAANTGLRYEGLEHLVGLKYLRWLNVSNNPLINDWCVDKIVGMLYKELEYLDLSHCPNVSHRALFSLYRMDNLDTLVFEDRDDPEFKLTCMMLEDVNPKLTIKGITHSINET